MRIGNGKSALVSGVRSWTRGVGSGSVDYASCEFEETPRLGALGVQFVAESPGLLH